MSTAAVTETALRLTLRASSAQAPGIVGCNLVFWPLPTRCVRAGTASMAPQF